MHEFLFGKANSLPRESFDPGPEIQVFAFNFLGVTLAYFMLVRIQMASISTPLVGVVG
jgi:hypothetical protein